MVIFTENSFLPPIELYLISKFKFEKRLKIQSVKLDFSNLIFQKSSTDQQGVRRLGTYFALKSLLALMSATVVKDKSDFKDFL